MPRSLPPLNALRAFEAAARRGSFKEAAGELCVTQGAVGQHVRVLEGWLGAPLFTRHNRRIVPTDAARSYLAGIGPALDRIAAATERFGQDDRAVLRVSAPATFALRWLVPRLARFRAEHSGVEVRLETSNASPEALGDPFDVIIRGGPDTFYGFRAAPFLAEERLPVCSPVLMDRIPLRRCEDLARHTLLHTLSLPRLWADWLARAGRAGLDPAATVVLDHFYLTLQAALDGLGVAMGPTALVADDLARGRLVAPFAGPALPARSYCTYLPEERANDPLALAFRAWLEREGDVGVRLG
ncbi:LysR substrate-binding domain-containing protein [Methylobacterium indicum]|uniref:LysR substrate-binding domain-containing protein n=1 Tax=Methylobacterium indicum TaxID=1775910 RepID=UPI002434A27E|nr:LysR substrate-binding domain-containing protein [Methylobacterium indicum]